MDTTAVLGVRLPYPAAWTLSLARELGRFCRRQPLGALALALLLLMVVMAVFAPWLAPYSYQEPDILSRLQGPSLRHPLGTDNLGRDVLSRLIWGARVELLVGMGAVLIAGVAATALGTLCGYFGGRLDMLVQRYVDVQMAFPGIVLLITIISMFEPGLTQVTVAIGLLLIPAATRVVRSAALTVSHLPYVEAARTLGASHGRIVLRHLLPNVFPPIMVTLTTYLGLAILLEATLSFLGYGVPPPQPSWGALLGPEARKDMLRAPLLSVWPGIAIFLAVYSFNMLGDALRDALDPRLRGRMG
jgi:peptide/nickel transport system permease protein